MILCSGDWTENQKEEVGHSPQPPTPPSFSTRHGARRSRKEPNRTDRKGNQTVALQMNYDTFRVPSLGPRWPWENTQSLQLCLMDRYAQSLKVELSSAINSAVAEFGLPLKIKIARRHTLEVIQRMLTICSLNGAICCWRFLQSLNRKREGEPCLHTALVIAFDGNGKQLRDESPHKPDQPPEWGWTQEDGLILLRLIHGQPLRNLVRHEMGHLLGIDHHHSNCVMIWECTKEKFCAKCKRTISETCKIAK